MRKLILLLMLGGCAQMPAEPRWCNAEPTHREGRAASRISPESVQLDWADSCIDLFGRYAARNQLRVQATYTPPAGAEAGEVQRLESLRAVLARAKVPPAMIELRVQARTTRLAGNDGLLVVDLIDR